MYTQNYSILIEYELIKDFINLKKLLKKEFAKTDNVIILIHTVEL